MLVEANTAFDIHSTKPQLGILQSDNEILRRSTGQNISCYRTGKDQLPVKIHSYWGGNSVLRISGNTNSNYAQGANPVYDYPSSNNFR